MGAKGAMVQGGRNVPGEKVPSKRGGKGPETDDGVIKGKVVRSW